MRRFKHLSKSDRIRIETLNNDGKAPKEIAEVVGVHISTIYRELPSADSTRTGIVTGQRKPDTVQTSAK